MIPKLQFDFSLHNDEINSLFFTNPKDIITTHQLNEVNDALRKVKTAVDNGYYVAGYISYEATYAFYQTNRTIEDHFPLLWFGVFNEPMENKPFYHNDFTIGTWSMTEEKHTYINHIQHILQLINEGYTNQVNYTVPFHANFSGSSSAYYEQLKKAQRAQFNAFLQFDHYDILSVSPELFFSIKNDDVTVRPMKGTIRRGHSFAEDKQRYLSLQQSDKNKFENDLITNLMKHELEQIADDIHIYDQYRIEKYPTVYQMTTSLTGALKTDTHPVDVLRSLFPCGSITGVPKEETIRTIATKEANNRRVYCGTIGYFTPHKEAIFNVAIRTALIDKSESKIYYHAGGAITKASTPEDEYEETIAKTEVLNTVVPSFKLLETCLLENGQIFLKNKHLNRLLNSAHYFNIPLNKQRIIQVMTDLEYAHQRGRWRIRLLVDKTGAIFHEINTIEHSSSKIVILAKHPIDQDNTFLYHKTTERSMFNRHRELLTEQHLDVLLWNDKEEITEFTIGNIVVEKNGRLLTPPVHCGLLGGTFREKLIEDEIIEEQVIKLNDLQHITSMWLINSVRKWIKVSLDI